MAGPFGAPLRAFFTDRLGMNWRDFLNLVLPTDGRISVRGVNFNGVDSEEHTWIRRYNDFDDIEQFLQNVEAAKRESFYSPATFGWDNNCKKTNIAFLKSFFLDLDCGVGEKKQFPSQAAGISALKNFCVTTGLPAPMLVSSGNGVHAYWVLDEQVTTEVWEPYQAGLIELAKAHGVPSDEATRQPTLPMRLPGTLHFKDPENPKPVSVLKTAKTITLEQFADIVPMAIVKQGKRGAPDWLTASLAGENGTIPPSKFMKLLSKSRNIIPIKEDIKYVIDGKVVFKKETIEKSAGCPHILHAYNNRETMDYQLWCGILQLAQYSVDRDEAITVMGEGHPDDDFDKNSAKAETFDKGAATCAYFRGLNADLCNGCIHNTKINSPYSLGTFIEKSETPEDCLIEAQYNERTEDVRSMRAPLEYPFPWIRPKNGGVAVQGILATKISEETKGDEEPEAMVYARDLWVEGRFKDPEEGDCVHIVHVSGQDGVQEFTVPQRLIAKKDSCLDILARHGFYAHDRIHIIQKYLNAWIKKYQDQERAKQAWNQFGFHNADTVFVVGDREYRSDGTVVHSPPSNATFRLIPHYTPKGSLEEWKKTTEVFAAPGNEARGFLFFAAFGSIFYHWSDEGTPLINITNTASGVGKTTIQRSIASVWGNPKACLLNTEDTINSIFQRLGVLQHLPALCDEMTNMDGEAISKLSFQVFQNRGKNRLMAHSNMERKNDTTWSLLMIGSSNSSMHQDLKRFKTSVDGELRRILELSLEKDTTIDILEGARLFNNVMANNYGLAGDIFIRHVILTENYAAARARYTELEIELQERCNFKQEDRLYRAMCAAIILGGEISHQLGLHEIDVNRVKEWAIKTVGNVRDQVTASSAENFVELLGRFINQHTREMLVVNGKPADPAVASLHNRPSREAFGSLIMRYEPDTSSLFIEKSVLGRWCTTERINEHAMLAGLQAKGMVRSTSVYKNMAENTLTASVPVRAIWLDTTKFGLDTLGLTNVF